MNGTLNNGIVNTPLTTIQATVEITTINCPYWLTLHLPLLYLITMEMIDTIVHVHLLATVLTVHHTVVAGEEVRVREIVEETEDAADPETENQTQDTLPLLPRDQNHVDNNNNEKQQNLKSANQIAAGQKKDHSNQRQKNQKYKTNNNNKKKTRRNQKGE